jgi:hypothetical protein
MIDIYKAHFKSGYPGHDSMRENALREFDGELQAFGREHERPGSFSAPSRTKMRLYKKGGHIGKERSHLHSMQEKGLGKVKKLIEDEKRLKKRNGGSLTNLHIPHPMDYGKSLESQPHTEKGYKMKKGGHMSKKHHGHEHKMGHYDHGGHYTEVYGHEKTFKHGGHAMHHMHGHHHGHHSSRHYAHGGDVYEREMHGEHMNHHPMSNYESQMRGEHCMHHAGSPREETHMHEHPSISGLKHGGRTHHHGHRSKFAAGGVAKVRHNQATMSGKQITNAPNRVKVY